MQNYSAKVLVINGQYESKPSSLLQFETQEGGKIFTFLNKKYKILVPSKVHNMRTQAVGSRSIFLTWQPPLQANGRIRGYFITFESKI